MKPFLLALFLALLTASSAPAVCTAPQWTITRAAPLVQYQTFFSAELGGNISYGVYLPAEYAANPTKNYPVLYWLHGGGGNLTTGEGFVTRLDSAIRRGVTAPFIVVLINGPEMFWTDSKPGATPFDAPIETVIIDDLIPHIDSTYRTIATREGRGIEGFSMGGRGSTRIGFKHHDKFSLVSNLAGAVQGVEKFRSGKTGEIYDCVFDRDPVYFDANSPQTHASDNALEIAAGVQYRIIVGANDTGNLRANQDFAALLLSLGIPYTFTTVPGVKHDYARLYDVLGDQAFIFFHGWASGQ